jgi:hypothetical protein
MAFISPIMMFRSDLAENACQDLSNHHGFNASENNRHWFHACKFVGMDDQSGEHDLTFAEPYKDGFFFSAVDHS